MNALLFGSIGTIADTSELQRQAFNDAFVAHGLDWHWDRDQYLALLHDSGGQKRIAATAAAAGQSVDAAAVHRTKSQRFRELLVASSIAPRPGVVETLRAAKAEGRQVGLVTTTTPENVSSLLDALAPAVSSVDFDVIVDLTHVEHAKPSPDAYGYALATLGALAADSVAVEDNADGVRSAISAGITCIAFPGENTVDHDFSGSVLIVDRLDPAAIERVGSR